ncbi:MAG: tetratricopeptide repeat protein [Kordiimonadaceae bacterium]|nr:tetratricopeptide repeat protein [Kordiimonadaceae bacterium]
MVTLTIFNAAYSAEELTVDQIIEGHIKAIGGIENIKELNNLVYSGGTYQEGDFTGNGNASMSLARPYFKLVGNKNARDSYMEGYDGSAWEYYSSQGVVIRTVGPPSEAIRHYAGVEHPLVNYRAKGSKAEIVSEVQYEGSDVVVIKLTRMDGFEEFFYIDQQNYQLKASSAVIPIHAFGEAISQITKISDYRNIGGVMIAHRFEAVQMPEGNVLSSMQWGKIEANTPLAEDWFSPPELDKKPAQQFAEKLYEQRSDINSVMWTYKNFRQSYPEINTNKMSNFAGFQMLKMGEIETSIALLEQNAQDYPDQSDARFELGRAYLSADRNNDARAQFNLALEFDPKNDQAKRELENLNN